MGTEVRDLYDKLINLTEQKIFTILFLFVLSTVFVFVTDIWLYGASYETLQDTEHLIAFSIRLLSRLFFAATSILLVMRIVVYFHRKRLSALSINKTDSLIELGENILKHKHDDIRNASLYVFSEMQELRNGTLSLLLELDYQENPIYQEMLNLSPIGSHLSPRELYATKRGFIVSHIEALRVVKKQLERKLNKKQ